MFICAERWIFAAVAAFWAPVHRKSFRSFGLFHHFMSFGSIVPEINENLKSTMRKWERSDEQKGRKKERKHLVYAWAMFSCNIYPSPNTYRGWVCVCLCLYLFSVILFLLRSLSPIIYSWCCHSSYSHSWCYVGKIVGFSTLAFTFIYFHALPCQNVYTNIQCEWVKVVCCAKVRGVNRIIWMICNYDCVTQLTHSTSQTTNASNS